MPQCAGLAIPVLGTRNTRPGFSAPAAVDFAPLLCAGDFADTIVTFRNTGGLDLFISDASILGDADFALVPAFVPFTIARGDSAVLRVRFQPLTPGDKAAVLRVINTAGEVLTLSVSLRGRRELLALSVDTVHFGIQLGAGLPARRAVMLRNSGTVPFTVSSVASTAGLVFGSVSGLPAVIAPGDSASVLLQFNDPGTDTAFSAALQWTTVPSCGPVSTTVTGERVTARATLVAGSVSGAPGEVVELPLILRGARHIALSGATTITARLRFNRTLLRPLSGDAGSVEGGDRVINVTLPLASAADSVLAVLRFEAALGTDTATALSFDDPIGTDGFVSIGSVPGRFTLKRVCREGGTRLIDPDGVLALHPNTPNPFNPMTEIRYEVIESAPTRLTVRNAIGAEVARLVDGMMAAGKYSVLFDATALPSGVYIAVLETPTRALTRPMLLVK
ncbi:MAG: choice-of-anchor D domain-containing protein [Ignavibacteria bacterium]|nr:choice-of-anchor D domain-containing protein [Ignavibacteria bacterium]